MKKIAFVVVFFAMLLIGIKENDGLPRDVVRDTGAIEMLLFVIGMFWLVGKLPRRRRTFTWWMMYIDAQHRRSNNNWK